MSRFFVGCVILGFSGRLGGLCSLEPGILTERYSLNPAWVEQVADATRQAVKWLWPPVPPMPAISIVM